jgi:hypothetical protein
MSATSIPKPKFDLGKIVATQKALDALAGTDADKLPLGTLDLRHSQVCHCVRAENKRAAPPHRACPDSRRMARNSGSVVNCLTMSSNASSSRFRDILVNLNPIGRAVSKRCCPR